MRRTVTLVQSRGKWLVVALCIFESVAITTGKVPTLTEISAQRRWLGPVLVGALAVHLAGVVAPSPRAVVDGECLLCPVAF